MRQGFTPNQACKKAVERLLEITPRKPKDIQIGFIAINKKGEYGSYSLQQGFDFGVTTAEGTKQLEAKFAVKA
jgi:N4-(beta-N-acetylglucosaminyl)-L-asparaginase